MPELPEARRHRFIKEYALSEYDAGVLTSTRSLADFFEQTAQLSGQAKTGANWIMGDLLRFYKDSNTDLKDLSKSPVSPKMLADMIALVNICGFILTGNSAAAFTRKMASIANEFGRWPEFARRGLSVCGSRHHQLCQRHDR